MFLDQFINSQCNLCTAPISCVFFRLTIVAACLTREDMVLVDVEGGQHPISRLIIHWLLCVGWIFFAVAQGLNYVYYVMHPSSPEGISVPVKDRLKQAKKCLMWKCCK